VGKVRDKRQAKACVECGDQIPVYQKYFCEKCFEEMLKVKIREEEKC
jgi:hypothetical protein